ncbi:MULTISPECIES: hypothetical protein [Niallia]|uniref:hypothetical protein n=1 Tax=Niallia TaxID=2837506 RepID=UPI0012E715CA|nr:hypothetical protein [Niallia circulans]MED4250363.1 hypothetical protein [Niallia circulans]QKH63438.1 hypothetical protein FOC77_23785 [Niallia circulans]
MMKTEKESREEKKVFITVMKTEKESREEKDGVHNGDENRKGEQGRERWCS